MKMALIEGPGFLQNEVWSLADVRPCFELRTGGVWSLRLLSKLDDRAKKMILSIFGPVGPRGQGRRGCSENAHRENFPKNFHSRFYLQPLRYADLKKCIFRILKSFGVKETSSVYAGKEPLGISYKTGKSHSSRFWGDVNRRDLLLWELVERSSIYRMNRIAWLAKRLNRGEHRKSMTPKTTQVLSSINRRLQSQLGTSRVFFSSGLNWSRLPKIKNSTNGRISTPKFALVNFRNSSICTITAENTSLMGSWENYTRSRDEETPGV